MIMVFDENKSQKRSKEISKLLKKINKYKKRIEGIDEGEKVLILSDCLLKCRRIKNNLVDNEFYKERDLVYFDNTKDLDKFVKRNKNNIYGIVIDDDLREIYKSSVVLNSYRDDFPVVYVDGNSFEYFPLE